MGVGFNFERNEYHAPEYLREEIEIRLKNLLTRSITRTFYSVPLFKDIAERASKQFKSSIYKHRCWMEMELEYQSRTYILPKGEPGQSSSEFSQGMKVKNSSIEIHTGDIALQKVSEIISSKKIVL